MKRAMRTFRRSREERLLLGLLAGFARYLGHDPWFVRTVFLFLSAVIFAWSPGAFLLWVGAYFLSAWLVPLES